MALSTKPFADLVVVTRSSTVATDIDGSGNIVTFGANTARLGYDMNSRAPLGFLIEPSSQNGVINNRDQGMHNGGAHSSTESTDLPALIPGAKTWKLTTGVSGDSNHSNTSGTIFGTSTQIVVSVWVWFPPNSTVTSAGITQDSASSTGTSVGYDFTRKGQWQRIWRPVVTHASTSGSGFQIRLGGMSAGQYFYATLLQAELGTVPTSTILTTGSAVTRAAESYRLTDSAFAAIWPASDARTNLLPYSEALENAAWTAIGIITTPNATASPNGAVTADRVTIDTSTGAHLLRAALPAVDGTVYSLSAFVKADSRDSGSIRISDGANGANLIQATFYLTSGTISTSVGGTGSVVTASIAAVGNSWYRVAIVGSIAGMTDMRATLYPGSTSGSLTGDSTAIFAWGMQLEVAPAAIAGFAANLATDPETFANNTWFKSQSVVTPYAAQAPDGTQTADLIAETTVNAPHGIQQAGMNFDGGQLATFSAYVKATPERSWVRLSLVDSSGTDGMNGWFRLDNGTKGGVQWQGSATNASSSMNDVGFGWYRCSVTCRVNNGRTVAMGLIRTSMANTDIQYAGTNGVGILAWGATLNQGETALTYTPRSTAVSPYIATSATAVTRNAGQGRSGFVIMDVTHPSVATTGSTSSILADLSDTTFYNRVMLRTTDGVGKLQAYVVTPGGPAYTTAGTATSATANTRFRVGIRWQPMAGLGGTLVTVCHEGGALDSVLVPYSAAITRFNIGTSLSTLQAINGRVHQVAAGSKALTDTIFQNACVSGAALPA